MNEIWEDIPNYEGLYKISNLGRLKNCKHGILKLKKDKDGYLWYNLSKHGIKKPYFIHRLVLLSFLSKSSLTVNHKNLNKQDNKLDNLEYLSIQENLAHYYKIKNSKVNYAYN